MDGLDRLIALSEDGLFSEGLGPEQEWQPVDRERYQHRHNRWWKFVAAVTDREYTDEANDADLPHWMSEEATMELKANN
jgi:hypothetical protein